MSFTSDQRKPELGMTVGLRASEIYGLHGHPVDWLWAQTSVIDVLTRQGVREHRKSKKSNRVVPDPAHILEGISVLAQFWPTCDARRRGGPLLMMRNSPLTWVGVAGFEPASSSSRTSGFAGSLPVIPARSAWCQ